ncbi:MAG TPA: M42 family metallopeptidase [Planctomycetia bacterium]|nr:M42 family metallopeptidase [Planctomycetia bacterium]
MLPESRAFLERLLTTPSPSGYEEKIQQVVREWARKYADEVRTDLHGNVIAVANPGGSPKILLDGHCDQIGFVVSHIDDKGYVYSQPIGGWDPQIVLGQKVVIWAKAGPVPGVIARKPKHLLTPEEMKSVPEIHEMWIDVGATGKDDTAKLVEAGDPVTVELGLRELRNGCISGARMDDATGVFVVFDALRRVHGQKFAPALYVVSAVQEEIGLRGAQTAAYGVGPTVGIAVDVTHATDCPTIDQRTLGEVKIGSGPVLFRGPNVNPKVFGRLRGEAEEHGLPVQVKGHGRGMANDTNAIQLVRGGVATACLGLPLRYMHSPVEVVSTADLDAAAELLAQFVLGTPADAEFRPGEPGDL